MNFIEAKAVWGNDLANEWNQFLGFRSDFYLSEKKEIEIKIAARSFYRLFINGEFIAHGPARSGHGYCRVDSHKMVLQGDIKLAIEVTAYDKPDKYSNTITLEPGLLTAEVTDDENNVIVATGKNGDFCFEELSYRESVIDLMSHSREIIEVYSLEQSSFDWRISSLQSEPKICKESPQYLPRRSKDADYNIREINKLIRISDIKSLSQPIISNEMKIENFVQPTWMKKIEDKKIIDKMMSFSEEVFTGKCNYQNKSFKITTGKNDCSALWELSESVVGFIGLNVEVTHDSVIDILHSDILDENGNPAPNSCNIRLSLKPGKYNFLSFEPYLLKYLKIVFRTEGNVTMNNPYVMDYMYPNINYAPFMCSDPELNQIFNAAQLTLRNNILDIFMDCPERERGGWLCDSFWMARATSLIFGDTLIEKDFLENCLLTKAGHYKNNFFPEVYPNSVKEKGKSGISSWSLWFALELYEYLQRTGDEKFVEEHRERMEQFVEGLLSFQGETGLLENLPELFVDWSQSNNKENLYPISVAINLLAAKSLEALAEIYSVEKWNNIASEIREKLSTPPFMILPEPISDIYPDALTYEGGSLLPNSGITEAAVALELWSGLGKEKLLQEFIDRMGPIPQKPSNTYIGKANLFIGLEIRLDVLSQNDLVDPLISELKAIHLPQIYEGPGTLYESVNAHGLASSLCHGFNGHSGYLLMKHIAGFHKIDANEKCVYVKPSPLELDWASGQTKCDDGSISLYWKSNRKEKRLLVHVVAPQEWKVIVEKSNYTKYWTIDTKINYSN